MTPREWAAILPLLALMVWMGTATRTFLPPISAVNARILQDTETNVEFHVKKQYVVGESLTAVAGRRLAREVRDAR